MRKNRWLVFTLAGCLSMPAALLAGDFEITVLDECGKPLVNAVAATADANYPADDEGRIRLPVTEGQLLSVAIDADGYYGMVHTFRPRQGIAGADDISLVQKKQDRRLFLFAGDAMLSRRYFEPRDNETQLIRPGHVMEDGQAVLQYIRPYVSRADFSSVNLETVLSDELLSDRLPKSVTFYSPNALADLMKWTGFDYVALGNNHTYDYRDEGVRSTLRAVEAAGLGHSGVGLDEARARAAYQDGLDGRMLSLLSYVGWPGTFTPSQSAAGDKGGAALGNSKVFGEDLASIKDGQISILQHHAGIEYAGSPAVSERTSLREAVNNGADIVIAHHPHVLQGIELHNNRLIAYSMGNFLFDQYIYGTQGGMLLYVWMDGETFHRAEIVPMNINGYVPTPATGAFRHWVLNRVARLSAPLGTQLSESGAHAVLIADAVTRHGAALSSGSGGKPIALWAAGASPVLPVTVSSDMTEQYRVGTDLFPRGDFESAGLFGTPVRSWILNEHASLAYEGGNQLLTISLDGADAVRTGMKVFDRVFPVSAPATVSLRVRSDKPAKLSFYMQRRRLNDSLDEGLSSGPLIHVGSVRAEGSWQTFSLDHVLPRLPTKSVRLLIDVESEGGAPTQVQLDDLSWIVWQTPWMTPEDSTEAFGTHVQFRRSAK